MEEFSRHLRKRRSSSRLNFPSLATTVLDYFFLLFWLSVLFVFESQYHAFTFPPFSLSFSSFCWFLCPLFSILFALTMKIADLMDEHGPHWFRGDALLFGALCGLSGCVLTALHPICANVILAMVLGYAIRRKIDYCPSYL